MNGKWIAILLLVMMAMVGVVSATAPTASFSGTPTAGTVPLSVQFTDTTSSNLLRYTEQFDNLNWTTYKSKIHSDSITAPDGTTTGDKLVEDAVYEADPSNNDHYVSQYLTLNSNTDYTFSVYMKEGERNWSALAIHGQENTWNAATFDIKNGVLGAYKTSGGTDPNLRASIISVGSGWYRCVVTFNSLSGAVSPSQLMVFSANRSGFYDYTGDGSSGIYLWGAQLENGTSATAYISSTNMNLQNLLTQNQADGGESGTTTGFKGDEAMGGATIASNTTQFWEGSHSIKTASCAGNACGVSTGYAARATPNTVYVGSVYVQRESIGGWVKLRLNFYNLTGDLTNSSTGTEFAPPATWTRKTDSGTSPSDCAYVGLSVLTADALGVQTYFIDGLQIEKAGTATTFGIPGSLAAGAPTSWSWDFGDGSTTSALQNPTHQYAESGEYTVTLTSTNADGSDTELKADYIDAYSSYPHSVPVATGTNNVVTALTMFSIMLIVAGIVGVLYTLLSVGGIAGGMRSNYGGNSVNILGLVGSIGAIMIRATLLILTYVIISPIIIAAGG